jgi:diadenosine tetraphosphate (Ap4A) HIT family hydrolase
MPAAVQRSAISPDCQRLTLRLVRRTHSINQMLGNSVPHVHTHIVLRFQDDPWPGLPFPWPDDPGVLPEEAFRATVDASRSMAPD